MFAQRGLAFIKRLVRMVVAPSTLVAMITKVIPINDEWYLSIRYYLTFGRPLDLANPQSFTAKLQWLKLYGNPSQYTSYADKLAVYEYVRATIGEKYLNRLLGVYERAEDIPWDALPDSFVLKATHASGWNLIVRDKSTINRREATAKCHKWLRSKYTDLQRESVYKNIRPCIICVEYLGDPDTDLFDYKLYCFNGKVKLIHVDTERFVHHKRTYYSPDWERLPFSYAYPVRSTDIKRPDALGEMITLAEQLCASMPFVRVDFYYISNRVVFGEMTFYPDGGFGTFSPPEWDVKIGSSLMLPFQQPLSTPHLTEVGASKGL